MSAAVISVVVPTHNCAAYLPAALASIQCQQVPGMEVLVVDDGSTDDTWQVLGRLAAADPRIIPLSTPGIGAAAARNACLAVARGEWVAFLDADDQWFPGKLERQYQAHLEHPDSVFSFTDYQHVSPQGEDLGNCFGFWPRFRNQAVDGASYAWLARPHATLFAENVVGTSTVMARRDALQSANGFDLSLPSATDWDLWLRLAEAGPVLFSTRVTTRYLAHRPGAISRNSGRRIEAMQRIYTRHASAARAADRTAPRSARARIDVARAEQHRNEQRFSRAFLHHLKASLYARDRRHIHAALGDLRRMCRH